MSLIKLHFFSMSGHALADTLFGGRPRKVRYEQIPTAVFSQPPAASVGLTEHQVDRTIIVFFVIYVRVQ